MAIVLVVAAALRVVASIAGRATGPESRFLCHNLCEMGATPFIENLEQIREWMNANPDEVVTLFIQDEPRPRRSLRMSRR